MLRIALEGGLVSVSLMMIYHKRHIAVFMAFREHAPISATGDSKRELKRKTGRQYTVGGIPPSRLSVFT